MVLVIGIIVILAAVVLIGISSYLSQAKTVASNFSQEQQSFSDKNKQINENFIDLGY
jgi:predicted PurR-regulated permease PerM